MRRTVHDYTHKLKSALMLAKAELSREQYEFLVKTLNKMKASTGITDGRLTTYVFVVKLLSKYTDIINPTEDGIAVFLNDLERKDYSEDTIALYRATLKTYLRRIGHEDLAEKIKSVKWPQSRLKKSDMLTHEEIYRMIKIASPMYKAIIITAYESGARPSEFLMLRVKDVQFKENYGYLSIPMGKTVSRTIPIILSVPYLRKWIYDYHPDPKPNNPLWYRARKPLNYKAYKRNINRLMHKANVKTEYKYPYIFRHTRATDLALHLTEEAMRKYFGWAPGSNMPSRYVHLAMQDVEEKVLEIYGIRKEKKPLYTRCLRCGTVNLSGASYCIVCGGPVTTESMAEEVKKTYEIETLLDRLKKLEEMYKELERKYREMK